MSLVAPAPSVRTLPTPTPVPVLVITCEREWQFAYLAAATCPTCAGLSTAIVLRQVAVDSGFGFAPFCVCLRGHCWPHIDIATQED